MLTKRLVEDFLSKRNYKWIEHGLRHSKGRKLLHFKSPLIKKYIKYTGQYNSNRELPWASSGGNYCYQFLAQPFRSNGMHSSKYVCICVCISSHSIPFVIKWQHTHCSEPCFSLSHMPWRSSYSYNTHTNLFILFHR